LPAGDLQASEQNVFFWFFESREDPKNAPLTVWLLGGPGSDSIDQVNIPEITPCTSSVRIELLNTLYFKALGGNGPCRILNDSKSTQMNEWSWNKHSNVLYISISQYSPVTATTKLLLGSLDLWVPARYSTDEENVNQIPRFPAIYTLMAFSLLKMRSPSMEHLVPRISEMSPGLPPRLLPSSGISCKLG